MPPLHEPTIEVEINEGLKRIDLVMTNHAQTGFFYHLTESYDIHVPYVFIECKNYQTEIANKETDQLSGRFSEKRGKFGILAYRKSKNENEENLLKRCQKLVIDKGEYIIPLNDEDIFYMLNCKLEDEDIDQYMDEKMRKLLLF